MKKWFLISALLAILLSLLFCEELAEIDHYYEILREKALTNISTLPAAREIEYLNLLQDNPDFIMAFFLAYEESSKLLLANPADLVSHHRMVWRLWEKNRDNYSLPFFLSYIAKITVTEERITPYRELFAEYGIYDLKTEYPDKRDLVIELNLWTRKYMTFKPTSGRDMAPYDIIKRSNLGRCEEMQIFFISAARAVGIPARPAMTPLWAHTDNNHAWVEVFINGNWSYLGAVEPAYETDDAWFSASAARAIMIMATAAFPDASDIVLREDRYSSLINSTPNYDSAYIKSRLIKIRTLDERGEVLPETGIAIMVFNWGMLRPIHTTETDAKGELDIVTGKGTFFITAAKDSLFALVEVPLLEGDHCLEIVLRDKPLWNVQTAMQYPDPQLPRREEREEWNDYRRSFEEEYNKLVAIYQDEVFPYPDEDSLLSEVWSHARNNKENFLLFSELNKPLPSTFLNLMTKIDEKFLWQADPEQWQTLYDTYQELKHLEYPDDILVNLLSPTVMFEEIPREKMKPDLIQWMEGNLEERLANLIDYIDENYEIDIDKAVHSLLPYDETMSLEYLTVYQHKMLVCSVLRANHIPASYSRIPDMINVYHGGEWRYYNLSARSFSSPEQKSEDERLTRLIISTRDEYDYPIRINQEQCTVSYLQGGLFYPYERQPESDGDNSLTVDLAPNAYQVQVGYRVNDDLTRFYLQQLDITAGVDQEEIFILEDYPRVWGRVTDELRELLDVIRLTDEVELESCYLILGDFNREPVRRTAERLIQAVLDTEIFWLGTRLVPDSPEVYQVNEEYISWLDQYPEMRERVLTFYYNRKTRNWTYYDGFWDNLPE